MIWLTFRETCLILPAIMYISASKTHTGARGKSYFTHRLVRSERNGKKVRSVTLLNLGSRFSVPKDHWKSLCARIQEILSPIDTMFATRLDDRLENEAQRIAAQLLASGAKISKHSESDCGSQPGTSLHQVDIESFDSFRPRTVGVENVGLWACQTLQLPQLFESLGFNGRERATALALIIGRLAKPGSELATFAWLSNSSALGELLEVDFEHFGLSNLYRTSDQLIRNKERIENDLFGHVQCLFDLSCTFTLYDLTNTYFEGAAVEPPKAKYGRSKDKRRDCKLLTLGLVLDASGFVRRSQVMDGNVVEHQTLQEMLRRLKAPQGALVVMDRGLATAENLQSLRDSGYRYVVVSRETKRPEFDLTQAVQLRTAWHHNVYLHKELDPSGDEVRLYCYSQMRAKKECAMSERFSNRFEKELEQLSAGLSRKGTVKRLDLIHHRVGRIQERSRGAAQHYQVTVTPNKRGDQAESVSWRFNPLPGTLQTNPGVYCLRSTETDWDESTLWRTYMTLTDLESVFRSLKSELGLRPIYHRKPLRSDRHLFITVLAYQCVKLVRERLAGHGISASWTTLREDLQRQVRVSFHFNRADQRVLHIRKASKPEGLQEEIYRHLEADPRPGGTKRTII